MGLEAFYPENEAESAYGIDYRGLYGKGYRGIIFDIDNTLVPHGAPADGRAEVFLTVCGSWASARCFCRTIRSRE